MLVHQMDAAKWCFCQPSTSSCCFIISLSWWFFVFQVWVPVARVPAVWTSPPSPCSSPLQYQHSGQRRDTLKSSALFFNLLISISFFNLWTYLFFFLSLIFGGDHILLCSVSLRVWGSTRVERAVRHLINSERLSLFPSVLFLFFFFNVGLFWHFCRVGNNAPFQLFFFFFRMIQMPYFHSCAKVVSAFLLLMLR